jgi:hypothetical protein
VLPSSIIRERLGKSVGLATLRRLGGGPLKLDALREAVVVAASAG